MNHLGLFEGIGGFSLAGRWAGWETKGWVEINPFCQQVLKYHFPEAHGFSDIKKFSYAVYKSILRNRGIKDRSIDIITGGFPCQPYSSAGLRKGTNDPRHLWPEMLRVISEVKPTWVVGENVRGIVSWSGGLVFEQVQIDLETIGYEVQAFVLPACSVGAPHRRDRVWFVAYKSGKGLERRKQVNERQKHEGEWANIWGNDSAISNKWPTTNPMPTQRERQIRGMESKLVASCEWTITHSKSESPVRLSVRTGTQHTINGEFSHHGHAANSDRRIRCQGRMYQIRRIQTERHVSPCGAWAMGDWKNFPTQSPLCGRNDGLSAKLAGIAFPRHRRESIQAYGNAIVPQVALQIFKAINDYESLNPPQHQSIPKR